MQRRGFWLRYTLFESKAESHCALWAFSFHRDDPARNTAAKAVFPASAVEVRAPFALRIGESHLDAGGCQGAFRGASWELSWQSTAQPFAFLKPRWEGLATSGNVAAKPALRVTGRIRLGGRTYTLRDAPGGQGHTWGRTHAREWNWGYAGGQWGWVAGATVRVASRLGRELRGTAAGAELDGQRFVFNGPLRVLRQAGAISPEQWLAELTARRRTLRVAIRPRAEDLIGVTYQDPAGGVRYCYHTEVADLRLSLRGKVVIAEAVAAFEYASEQPLPGVPIRL